MTTLDEITKNWGTGEWDGVYGVISITADDIWSEDTGNEESEE